MTPSTRPQSPPASTSQRTAHLPSPAGVGSAIRDAIREALPLCVLAAVCAAVAAWLHPRPPSPTGDEITAEAARAAGGAVLWVDARSIADYNAGHVPGALPLNEDEWEALLPAVLEAWEPGRRIVVYCRSHGCQTSRAVARRLREEAQLPEVFVLHGGWEAWQAAGNGPP